MERVRYLLPGVGIAMIAGAIALLPGKSLAQPNCATCIPAYEACLASGATDCDDRYAVCLRYCPYPSRGRMPIGSATSAPLTNPLGSATESDHLLALRDVPGAGR